MENDESIPTGKAEMALIKEANTESLIILLCVVAVLQLCFLAILVLGKVSFFRDFNRENLVLYILLIISIVYHYLIAHFITDTILFYTQ